MYIACSPNLELSVSFKRRIYNIKFVCSLVIKIKEPMLLFYLIFYYIFTRTIENVVNTFVFVNTFY